MPPARHLVVFPKLLILIAALFAFTPAARALGDAELQRIGKGVWQNECGGTVEGLTSWNTGENFASLGIGHFIWYPAGVDGPFEESFPKLIAWYQQRGVSIPGWLSPKADCPWPDRASFQRDLGGNRLKELRALLASTVKEQTLFIIARLDQATPRFTAKAGKHGAQVQRNIALLRQTAAGNFALIDYVNFKGEGLSSKETYNGHGWGLLQVLMDMQPEDAAHAPSAFATASKRVLTRRVANSPAERGEKRWLPGWLNRCDAYAR